MATWLMEKKGLVSGFVKLSERHDGEKGEATHIRLTVDEYDGLQKAIASYKRQLAAEQSAHTQDVKKLKEDAANNVLKVEKAANEKVADANAKIAAAEAERDRQAGLNTNLLRICRERANAKRGLQPKKTHSGYRFSGKIMQTKAVRGRNKKEGTLYADVWTAIIETPYNGTIPIQQIEDRIFNDLRGSDGILSRLGIMYWHFRDDPVRIWKGRYADAVNSDDNPNGLNYLFDYKFMVNPKTQLWEVQIMTTKPIRALAEMM